MSSFRENDKDRSRFGIVAGRFNGEISRRLVEGARAFLLSKKVPLSDRDIVWVPGAFELSVAALQLARTGHYRAVVAVGCILEGETAHHHYLAQATLNGLLTAGLLSGVPVTCGVITAPSWKAALNRSQKKGLNRGREAAAAAWEMVHGSR